MYFNSKKGYNPGQRGYITLISVLVVGVVGTAVALSLILLSLGASRTSLAIGQSIQARAVVNACADTALQQIRTNTAFAATTTLTLAQGACTSTVAVLAGQNRTINATGTVGTIVRKVKVSITAINPKIIVSSWQEVP